MIVIVMVSRMMMMEIVSAVDGETHEKNHEKTLEKNREKNHEDEVVDDEITEDEVVDDEITEDEVVDDEIIEDEVVDDEITDDEVVDDEITDDEITDDEVVDDEIIEDEVVDDEIIDEDDEVMVPQVIHLNEWVSEVKNPHLLLHQHQKALQTKEQCKSVVDGVLGVHFENLWRLPMQQGMSRSLIWE
jgi:hypothetical protein